MGFRFPYGNKQQLNLDWFIKKFKELLTDWQNAEAGIAGSLQAEIDRAEAAMSDVFTARDAAISAKNDAVSAKLDAVSAKNSAENAATSANGDKTAAQNAASAAYNSQVAADGSALTAATNKFMAEAWATGEMNGSPVPSSAAQHENNAKYYAGEAASSALNAASSASDAHADSLLTAADVITTGQNKDDTDSLKDAANAAALRSEGWADGTQNGTPVTSGSPYYQNNSKYFKEEAEDVLNSIPADYSELAAEVATQSEKIDELKTSVNGNSGFLNYADFIVGALLTSSNVISIDTSYTTIICTPSPLIYPKSITITPKSGYRMAILWSNAEGTYAATSTGWTTEAVVIPANKHFMVNLRRVTDAGAIQPNPFVENYPITPSLIGVTEKTVFDKLKNPIYVSTSTGNDNTGDGTALTPYKTITKAISTGAEEIHIEAGLYKETISVSGRNIKLLANWGTYVSGTTDNLPKVIIDGDSTIATALTIEDCPSVQLEGIVVQNCTSDGALINKCYNIDLVNCEFNSNGRNGIVINYSNGTIRDCKANSNANDGFNMNYFGDTQFFNCSGHDNGDDGISHHQGTTGLIDGGEWYNNVKGGVASPCYGAIVDVMNVYSHDNGYGIYANQDATGVSRSFRLWNCVLVNNSNYGIYSRYTDCYSYNNKVSGNTAGQTTAPGGHLYTLD